MVRYLLAVSLMCLSACGGGGGAQVTQATQAASSVFGTIFDGPAGTITQLPLMPAAGAGPFSASEVASYDALGTLDLSNATVGAPNSISATYDGYVSLQERETRFGETINVYVGRATLAVDFLGFGLTGTTSNYFRNTGTPGNTVVANQVDGTIPFTDGTPTSSDGFSANFYGQLIDRGRVLDVKTSILGDFVNSNGQDLAVADFEGSFGNLPDLTLLRGRLVAGKR